MKKHTLLGSGNLPHNISQGLRETGATLAHVMPHQPNLSTTWKLWPDLSERPRGLQPLSSWFQLQGCSELPAGIMLGWFCSSSRGSRGDGEEVGTLPEARDLHSSGHVTTQGTVR